MSKTQKQWLLVVGVLGLAAAIRFWALDSRPGYEWDEPVYTNIATNLAHLGFLRAKPDFGSPIEPYVYHPPFYFLLLAGWFKLVGAGITSARVLAGLMSLVFLVLTYLFMRWYLSWRAAFVPMILMAVDGWLLYCNRISWMENTLLVIVVTAVWVYAAALANGSRNRFLAAGFLVGLAVIFKHVGAYLVGVVLLHWLITQKYHRRHLQLFGVVVLVVGLYLVGMAVVFGHEYWRESGIQFSRTFGNHDNRGSVKNLGDLIRPLIQQYYIFYATILMAVGGVVLVVVRILQIIRQRSFDIIRLDSLLFAWVVGSLISFGAINLKFPQYSVLVIVPLYLYLCVEALKFVKSHSVKVRRIAFVVFIAILALNGLTYVQRIVLRDKNALQEVAEYAKVSMAPHGLTITEEPIGDSIPQPYCKLYHVRTCTPHAKYVIIYRSFTEEPPNQPGLQRLISKSIKLAHFADFKAKITVYQINKRLNSDAYPGYREHNELLRAEAKRRHQKERLKQ